MFELHITCTKDIEKLHIDFADGTSVVQHKEPTKEKASNKPAKIDAPSAHKTQKTKKSPTRAGDFVLDTEEDFDDIQQDIVQKPDIPERSDIKVADEIQNLQI